MITVELKFDNDKSCFLRCSPSVFDSLCNGKSTSIELRSKTHKLLLLATSKLNGCEGTVYLNQTYAQHLKLSAGSYEAVPFSQNGHIRSVELVCDNINDYKICEVSRDQIETLMLHQVGLLTENQPFVIWLSNSSAVKLIPNNVQPLGSILINELTHVSLYENHCNPPTTTSFMFERAVMKVCCIDTDKSDDYTLPMATVACHCINATGLTLKYGLIRSIDQQPETPFLLRVMCCTKCIKSENKSLLTVERYLSCVFKDNGTIILEYTDNSNNDHTITIPRMGLVRIPNILPPNTKISTVVRDHDQPKLVLIDKTGDKLTHVSTGAVPPTSLTILPSCVPHFTILDDLVDDLISCFTLNNKSITLITGSQSIPKVGKTFLMKAIVDDIRLRSFYMSYRNLTTLRGKRIENIMKELVEYVDECYLNQPSVLLLDDIDVVLPPRSKNEDATGDELFGTRLAHNLMELLTRAVTLNIEVIISTQNHDSCHPVIVNGCNRIHVIPLLNAKAQHALLVEEGIRVSSGDLDSLSLKGSLSLGEVYKLKAALQYHDSDYKQCLDSLMVFELSKKKAAITKLSLEDCGGLEEAKEEIKKMLILPVRHPDLFSQIPFALNRGLLLFGCPGVGKTHIVRAIANEINMSFMVVKGPELLNKYIGASESAVRDVFAKAQQNSPTLIFFDEFDSLAPIRGDDTTGVMDRVVNQLLTELDGVTKRDGVYVIAATSRPDVIDPALLRPGRIGRKVFCPIPGPSDRKEIWWALLKGRKYDLSVDASVLARKTEFFTGADIKAVIYNAHLYLLKELHGPKRKDPCLSMEHFNAALKSTQPSLSQADLESYEKTYDLFLRGRVRRVGYKVTQK